MLTKTSMQYHCILVITTRPFFASAKKLIGLLPSEIAATRDACTNSANSVARLIQIYRRLYGLRRINVQAVHLIFTVTLIHVFTACGATDQIRSDAAWKNLEICSQALSEIGLAYKNAARALEVIMGMKSELLRRSRSKAKRHNPWSENTDSGSSMYKKRKGSIPEEHFDRRKSASTETNLSAFDPGMSETGQAFNFMDSSFDEFSLDALFWSGFNNLDFPQFPSQEHQNNFSNSEGV